MKAVILGTQHPDVHETEREILLAAGSEGLRQMAGYIPPKMPIDKPTFPPLAEKFVELSDIILKAICGEMAHNSSPRVPYLVLIWLLVGRSNIYRLNQHLADDLRLRQVAGILMRIALSNSPYNHDYTHPIAKRVYKDWIKSEADDLNLFGREIHELTFTLLKGLIIAELSIHRISYVVVLARFKAPLHNPSMITDGIRLELRTCVESWQCLPDEELFQIMSQLMLDILPSEDSTA